MKLKTKITIVIIFLICGSILFNFKTIYDYYNNYILEKKFDNYNVEVETKNKNIYINPKDKKIWTDITNQKIPNNNPLVKEYEKIKNYILIVSKYNNFDNYHIILTLYNKNYDKNYLLEVEGGSIYSENIPEIIDIKQIDNKIRELEEEILFKENNPSKVKALDEDIIFYNQKEIDELKQIKELSKKY